MINTEALISAIYENYGADESRTDKRSHLGASSIGHNCLRSIYYEFRWYGTSKMDGRILRLFETGKREEARVIDNLKSVGFVLDESVEQVNCRDNSGHIGGSVDGIIYNIPKEYLSTVNTKAILEVKTHSDKNFKKLQVQNVKSGFSSHYAQVQIYMGMLNIQHTWYVAVNKNTDELYVELIQFDENAYNSLIEKAQDIVISLNPPPKVKDIPGWWECKMCKFNNICHENAIPARNCRTCKFSSPAASGKWECNKFSSELSYKAQLAGCDHYILNK